MDTEEVLQDMSGPYGPRVTDHHDPLPALKAISDQVRGTVPKVNALLSLAELCSYWSAYSSPDNDGNSSVDTHAPFTDLFRGRHVTFCHE